VAKRGTESPARTDRLMEEVVERENCKEALKRVKSNQGSAGIDGMTVGQLPAYLKEHWPKIREQLLSGTYEPQPVKRVEIPKPDGGVRKLGIPTVLDRFVQQAVARAQEYMVQGHRIVVDFDLEKFFDRVNHDKLMGRIAQRVEDKRLLKLIRALSWSRAGTDSCGMRTIATFTCAACERGSG
jgi:RNA-directed DNA polymerase